MEIKEVMGQSKPENKYKKHPKHKQSPGACSVFQVKNFLIFFFIAINPPKNIRSVNKITIISQFSASACTSRSTSNKTMDCSSCSPLSSFSSSSSFHLSPMDRFQYPTQGKGFLPSRSLALVSIRVSKDCYAKKNGGLWSKLLRSK
ncbi:hypothetical protein IMY05_010G0087300 [Salix suchowensis]|nr:hypothetical protein IMY05_010G0087300 [Salix suchowensis]